MADLPVADRRVRIRTYVDGSLTGTRYEPAELRLTYHKAQARMIAEAHQIDIDGFDVTALDANSTDWEKGNTTKLLQIVQG